MSQSPEFSDDASSKKRKRATEETNKKSKQAKRPKNNDTYEEIDEINNLNPIFSRSDANLIADHVAKKQKRFDSDATSLELEETRISASAIVDTTDWNQIRTLDNLPKFLKHVSGNEDLKKTSKDFGAPHTIVVAGAGLRAADITRALREFQSKEAKVAKLFAKHIKISESIEMLKTTRISIGVGTPARLSALLDDGSLKSNNIRRLVIDASHIDQKKRGIVDMRETLSPLITLLNRNAFKSRLSSSEDKLSLLFY